MKTASNKVCGQAECYVVPLYSREGRHLHGRLLQNSATHTKALQVKGKICVFVFGGNCPFNVYFFLTKNQSDCLYVQTYLANKDP